MTNGARINKPRITVYTPCTCPKTEVVDLGYGAFERPRGWWDCRCGSTVVDVYECNDGCFDGIEGAPTPEAVAAVERMHPGMDLRYYKAF